ncbi:MAG: NUDIX hydrolase [Gammaproteobacteria bacterium]|nr:NUDIX hydrolase [Gammaproteobacteria bacterium]
MYQYDYPHPAVTTDVVVFTIRRDQLMVLLIKRGEAPFQGEWALPGGFVGIDETIEDAAARELREETGVDQVYLEQLYTFGAVDRDPRERVISVAYFALIPSDKIDIRAATDAEAVGWFEVDKAPTLAFDHNEILAMAHERLQAKLGYSTIAFCLLPSEFTLTELQTIYETILGEPVDKRNFRKQMAALGELQATSKKKRVGPHRPATLYRLKHPNDILITK